MIKVKVNYRTDKSRLRKVVKDTQKMSLYVGVKKGLEDRNMKLIKEMNLVIQREIFQKEAL